MAETVLKDLDAILVTSENNRYYFTKFRTSFGCVLIFPDTGKKYLLTDFRYAFAAKQRVTDCDVIVTDATGLYREVTRLLTERGARTVGFEDEKMTVAEHKTLKKELKAFELKPLGSELSALRISKSADEVERIKAAQAITEKVLADVLPMLKAGVTEKDISAEIAYGFLKAGADGPAFDNIVSFGENTADCHHEPSDRKLENGDIVLFDIGAKLNGYCSDMTRTFCLGEPSRKMSDIYSLVLAAQNYVLKHLRAGMTGREADSLAREYFRANGYDKEFGHSLGHGVGVEIHEMPRLSVYNDDVLPENAVVTVEPGLYIEGFGGVRIEDMVLLKKDGIENLTNFPKNFII